VPAIVWNLTVSRRLHKTTCLFNIYSNKAPTCDWMFAYLKEQGIKCVKLHGETSPAHRKGLLDKYHNGDVDVIICTDLGSRGINTIRVCVCDRNFSELTICLFL
jgi:superfamily II DNA/RNA helicase